MTSSNTTLQTLPLLDFNQLVQNQAQAILANSNVLTDFQVGSILEALIEANAAQAIWIQALISSVLAIARLQTSMGNNVDTFINQFGYERLPASASTGVVTFGRTSTSGVSYVPVGAIISTSINQIQFIVTLNSSVGSYDPTTNSYVLANGISTITNIPVECTQTGTIGNVMIGQIDTINSGLINVNTVTNPASFTNGQNIATDIQAKNDFVLYLQSLSRATYLAIAFSVLNAPLYGNQITRYQICENIDESGNTLYGFFFVVVDDGTGSPSDNLIDAVYANIALYRGLSIMWDVIAPVVVTMTLTMTLVINQTGDTPLQTQVTENVKNALVMYINSLPIGGTKIINFPPNLSGFLYFSELYDIIFNADPNIISISSLTLNSGTSDVPLNFKEVALTATTDITVSY